MRGIRRHASEAEVPISASPVNPEKELVAGKGDAINGFVQRDDEVISDCLKAAVQSALTSGELHKARCLITRFEQTLQQQPVSQPDCLTAMVDVAISKAQIALATGDFAAARAILVVAVERDPNAPQLRSFLAETMLAVGRASDVRSVLQHVGRSSARHDGTLQNAPNGDAD